MSLLHAVVPDPLRGICQHESGMRGVGYGSEVIYEEKCQPSLLTLWFLRKARSVRLSLNLM